MEEVSIIQFLLAGWRARTTRPCAPWMAGASSILRLTWLSLLPYWVPPFILNGYLCPSLSFWEVIHPSFLNLKVESGREVVVDSATESVYGFFPRYESAVNLVFDLNQVGDLPWPESGLSSLSFAHSNFPWWGHHRRTQTRPSVSVYAASNDWVSLAVLIYLAVNWTPRFKRTLLFPLSSLTLIYDHPFYMNLTWQRR